MASSKELHRFKTEINLTEYAASCGYVIDRKESSKNSIVMRAAFSNDKVIISKGHDGHWTYFSVRNRQDNGSIIDFVQHRFGKNLGEVRHELRPWLSGNVSRPRIETYCSDEVESITKDRNMVAREFERAVVVQSNDYLRARGIRQETIRSSRFYGQVFLDERNNVLFPHFDEKGLSGFEVKNRGFTGFAKHGKKTLWCSNVFPSDTKFVLVESAIDALSYQQLHGDTTTRYASTGGQFDDEQCALVVRVLEDLPNGSTVVLGFDNDANGDAYADVFRQVAPPTVRVIREVPREGDDWNKLLQILQSKMSPG